MALLQEHKIFMVEAYFRSGHRVEGVWQYSIHDCFEEFRQEFPNLVLPYNTFRCSLNHCIQLFRETGSVLRKKGSGRPTERTEEVIENVRQIMEEDPRTSVRRLSQQVQLSTSTCQKILKKDIHLYPYRLQSVQQLHEPDYPQRVEYCQWFLNTLDYNLLEKTFFTDEAWFHLNGYVNSQNMRLWSSEKPNFIEETPLHPQKLGVWAAISRRRIVGPYFFEGKSLSKDFICRKINKDFFQALSMQKGIERRFYGPFSKSFTTMNSGLVISNKTGPQRIQHVIP